MCGLSQVPDRWQDPESALESPSQSCPSFSSVFMPQLGLLPRSALAPRLLEPDSDVPGRAREEPTRS